MNTETDPLVRRVVRLEVQSRRLRITAYLIWPVVWLATVAFAFMPGRVDEKAMKAFLRWIQEASFGGVIVVLLVVALGFLLKVASDFKRRGSRFALNPGSKGQ